MPTSRSESSPLGERFNLDLVIDGLANDLRDLRAGLISLEDARARADLAKQIFNGLRLVINGRKLLERQARQISEGP